ncbi:tyrosine-type recombinase/integrase [Halostreptopolyspora alba]|uniref:Site-specific integrase n=1 Tax=Halostreptopolyspora alba TaxID=2487137 RepID=A0A3N0E5U4_9ACTN|nr:site-specific integrase [Nocardiopsaceae bacterium YIM 96095]
MAGRGVGEGTIYRYRNGYAAQLWVTTPDGKRARKTVYGKDRETVHSKLVKLQAESAKRPIATSVPSLENYLDYWMREVVIEPDYSPVTVATYGQFVRYYLVPYLGKKKLDKLNAKNLREWVNTLRRTCQCCAQGKDAARKPGKRKCCAAGDCCQELTSESNIYEAKKVLRSALSNAMREELVSRNAAELLKLSKPRTRKAKPWTLAEVHRFLASARADDDPLYAAYVLLLTLGLRKGELLGLWWPEVDQDAREVSVEWQLTRVGRKLIRRRKTKTEDSDTSLPLPELCLQALNVRAEQQARQRADATTWEKSGYVFTTKTGRPVDPRSFARLFDARCAKAGVRRIEVHTTRKTCATLLAALDVHPRVAMRILRHSQMKLTMDLYTEVHDSSTVAALKKLGSSLHGDEDAPDGDPDAHEEDENAPDDGPDAG